MRNGRQLAGVEDGLLDHVARVVAARRKDPGAFMQVRQRNLAAAPQRVAGDGDHGHIFIAQRGDVDFGLELVGIVFLQPAHDAVELAFPKHCGQAADGMFAHCQPRQRALGQQQRDRLHGFSPRPSLDLE